MINKTCLFTPKPELSAKQNLDDFISLARDRLTTWSNIKGFIWSAHKWPTNQQGIRFTKFEYRKIHHTKPIETHHLMHHAFAEVARAYLRYNHTIYANLQIAQEVQALRVIEFVLRQDMIIPDITKFCQRHWDMAVNTIKHLASRQGVCTTMLKFLRMLEDFYILTVDASFWRNPYWGQNSYDVLNGTRAPADVKASKLPNQDALLAIAEVFSRYGDDVQEDTDIMVTCITGLLISAPMRISETLRFRTNCLRDEADKNGNRQYYLSYWVPKTNQFARKGIPTTMAEVTIAAIERLILITEKGRKLALYMETNPEKFYRHENCPDVPDDKILTGHQVLQALGYNNRRTASNFVKKHTGTSKLKGFTLDALWQLVLSEHRSCNPDFPYQEPLNSSIQRPLKMSESLLCFRRGQLKTHSIASPVLLAQFYADLYSARFTKKTGKNHGMNFFLRNGYEPMEFNSHSLRHLLNRLARGSGISIDMLTEWSSRATCQQTRTYIHDDPIKSAAEGAILLRTIQEQVPLEPVTNEDAELYGIGPFHRSRYGICRRSWRIGPCNKFADCLNCSELLMCKGDKIAAKIINLDRDNLVMTYTAAQKAIATGERSASRWTEIAELQIERLNQLLAVLNHPNIPDGSPIEMAGADFSHEKVIVSERAEAAGVKLLDRNELRIAYGDDLMACLELLRSSGNA